MSFIKLVRVILLKLRSVVGTNKNRIIVDKDGKCWRIDNSGSLEYRFLGQKRTLSRKITEMDTMKFENDVFADITDQEIFEQILELIKYEQDYINYLEKCDFLKGICEGLLL